MGLLAVSLLLVSPAPVSADGPALADTTATATDAEPDLQQQLAQTIAVFQGTLQRQREELNAAPDEQERAARAATIAQLEQQLRTLQDLQRALREAADSPPPPTPEGILPEQRLEAIRERQERTLDAQSEERLTNP